MISARAKISLEDAFNTEFDKKIEELGGLGDLKVQVISAEMLCEDTVQSRIAMLTVAVETTRSFVDNIYFFAVQGVEDVARIDEDIRENLRAPTLEARFQHAAKGLRDLKKCHPKEDHRLYDTAIAYAAHRYIDITGHHPKA